MYADLIELDGSLPGEMRNYLGKSYTFWEKLRLGGTGSPKCIYETGNPILDTAAAMNLDTNYCNFELFPDGLVIRLYKVNKLAAVAIQRKELEGILIQERSQLSLDTNSDWRVIFKLPKQPILFMVPENYQPAFERFFKHVWFKDFPLEKEFVI